MAENKTEFELVIDSNLKQQLEYAQELEKTMARVQQAQERDRERIRKEKEEAKRERQEERKQAQRKAQRRAAFGEMKAGAFMAGGSAIGATASGFAGSAGGMVTSAGVGVAGVTKMIAGAMKSLSDVFKGFGIIGSIIGGAGKMAAATFGVAGTVMQAKQAVAQQVAARGLAGMRIGLGSSSDLDPDAPLGTITGQIPAKGLQKGVRGPGGTAIGKRFFGPGYGAARFEIDHAIAMGMTETQALQQYSAVAQAAGIQDSMAGLMRGNYAGGLTTGKWAGGIGGPGIMEMLRTGIGAGSIGALLGSKAFTAGKDGQDPAKFTQRVVAAGFKDGLRGSKLDQFASTVTSAITQLAGQGIRTDINALGKTIGNLRESMGGAGRMATARVAGGLAQAPAQAKQQMLAPFKEAFNALIMAEAFGSASSFGGGLTNLENMGAGGALSVARRNPFIGKNFLRTMVTGDLASSIIRGGKAGTGGVALDQNQLMRAPKSAQMQAIAQTQLQRTMGDKAATDLLRVTSEIQIKLNSLGAIQTLVKKVVDGLDKIAKLL